MHSSIQELLKSIYGIFYRTSISNFDQKVESSGSIMLILRWEKAFERLQSIYSSQFFTFLKPYEMKSFSNHVMNSKPRVLFVTNEEIVTWLIWYFQFSHSVILKNDLISVENLLLEKESQIQKLTFETYQDVKIYDVKDLEIFDL